MTTVNTFTYNIFKYNIQEQALMLTHLPQMSAYVTTYSKLLTPVN
jgi:hypothetical protein